MKITLANRDYRVGSIPTRLTTNERICKHLQACKPFGAITLLLALVGCAYVPPSPTEPTAIAAAAPPAVFAIELLTSGRPNFDTGSMQIAIRTRDVTGELTSADVSCSSTSGVLFPARFDSKSRASFELTRTTISSTVICASRDVTARLDVDMSAWSPEIQTNEFVGAGSLAGLTRVLILPVPHIKGVPLTRVALDWGDGTVEESSWLPLEATPTMLHRYQSPGRFHGVAKLEWPGGSTQREFTILGGPPGSKP